MANLTKVIIESICYIMIIGKLSSVPKNLLQGGTIYTIVAKLREMNPGAFLCESCRTQLAFL